MVWKEKNKAYAELRKKFSGRRSPSLKKVGECVLRIASDAPRVISWTAPDGSEQESVLIDVEFVSGECWYGKDAKNLIKCAVGETYTWFLPSSVFNFLYDNYGDVETLKGITFKVTRPMIEGFKYPTYELQEVVNEDKINEAASSAIEYLRNQPNKTAPIKFIETHLTEKGFAGVSLKDVIEKMKLLDPRIEDYSTYLKLP